MQVMNDVNIIICCKLREHIIPGIDRTISVGINGCGIFVKLCGRNGETPGQERESARRDMRAAITDFHARLSANIPEER